MAVGETALLGRAALDEFRHLGVAITEFSLIVLAVFLDSGKLALTWRVIHQGDEASEGVVQEGLDHLDHGLVSDLAAHVQEVLGAQQPRRLRLAHHVGGVMQHVGAHRIVPDLAYGQGVEDRGDP